MPSPSRTSTTLPSVPGAPPPNLDYSHVVTTSGPIAHVAGFMGDLPDTGAIVEGGVVAQAEQAMRDIQTCLEAAGSGLGRIVRRRLYLVDIRRDLRAVQGVWMRWVPEPWPVSTAIQVGALAKVGALVEIEVDAEV